MPNLILLPQPRSIDEKSGDFTLKASHLLMIDAPVPQELFFAARRIQAAIQKYYGFKLEIVASAAVPSNLVGMTLRFGSQYVTHEQGYVLDINENGIVIEGLTEQGIFYGGETLAQILKQTGAEKSPLPCLTISDYPDFDVRGVMLDISRNRVTTLETTLELVDKLAGWKINQFQLYIEHTFAYHQHPEVWAEASPFTGEEIIQLDAYCRERFIELVPNMNVFGHMAPWLKHPRYAPLAEAPDGWEAWGQRFDYPFSLNPTDPASLELVKSMLNEYLPYFTSPQVNVGLDETLDVGQGKSKEAVEKFGRGKVYLYFLNKIYKEVSAHNKKMLFWGDIIVEHPELIPELPRDAVALEWGYEADHPFAEHGERFASAGLTFYVCPGTSTWNSVSGRTANTLANLLNAAENGRKNGAVGYLITDWGDNGHWQSLPMSYLGFGMGAAYSWCLAANREADVPSVISLHAFEDASGNMGKVAYQLGNVYAAVGNAPHNGSVLFHAMQRPLSDVKEHAAKLAPDALDKGWKAIDEAMQYLDPARPASGDAELVKREFRLAERILRHAIMRARFANGHKSIKASALYVDMKAIIAEFEDLWLKRSRPGGLADSVARLEKVKKDYA